MKRPRLRYSIAGMMLMVLLVASGFWLMREVDRRRRPSPAEWEADRHYKASLAGREVAELMLKMFETSPDQPPIAVDEAVARINERSDWGSLSSKPRPTTVAVTKVDTSRPPPPPDRAQPATPKPRDADAQAEDRRKLQEAVARARVVEQDAHAQYRRVWARRSRWFGF